MNHEEVLSCLDDYLDGTLSSAAHREVDAHLAGCAGCREELSSLGALLDTVSQMRGRNAEPPQDLWPAIASRIQGEPRVDIEPASSDPQAGAPDAETGGAPRARPIWTRWTRPWLWAAGTAGLAVAALLLLAVLGGEGGLLVRLGVIQSRTGPPASSASIPGRPGEGVMTSELAMLDAQVKDSRKSMPPQPASGPGKSAAAPPSWRAFDQSLSVLDDAIKDSRAALERDPHNPFLQKSLLAAYQKQLELIRWANRVIR